MWGSYFYRSAPAVRRPAPPSAARPRRPLTPPHCLTLTHTHSRTHTRTHSPAQSHSLTHTHSHTLAHTHSLTHTHSLAHTHSLTGAAFAGFAWQGQHLVATAWWPNVKANPSKDKMCKTYEVKLRFHDEEGYTRDVVTWHSAGAARNCYFFNTLNLVLKEFTLSARWNSHELEAEGYLVWHAQAPQELPAFHGRFLVEMPDHNGSVATRDVLLMEKVGYSLAKTLEALPVDVPLSSTTELAAQDCLQDIARMAKALHSKGCFGTKIFTLETYAFAPRAAHGKWWTWRAFRGLGKA